MPAPKKTAPKKGQTVVDLNDLTFDSPNGAAPSPGGATGAVNLNDLQFDDVNLNNISGGSMAERLRQSQPPTLSTGEMATGFLEGAFIQSPATMVKGAWNLGREIMSTNIPQPDGKGKYVPTKTYTVPPVPGIVEKAASDKQLFGANKGNPNPSKGAGKLAGDVGSFMLGGEALKGIGAAGKAVGGAARVPEVGNVIGKAIQEAGAAGGVSMLQSGGEDPEGAIQAALVSGVTSGAFNTISGLLKAIPNKTVYEGLKFPNRITKETGTVDDILSLAREHNISIDQAGANKAGDLAAAFRQRKAGITAPAAPGAPPNPYNNATRNVNNEAIDPKFYHAFIRKQMDEARVTGDVARQRMIQKLDDDYQMAHGMTKGTPAQTTTSPILGANGQPQTTTIPAVPGTPMNIPFAGAEESKNAFYGLLENAFGKYKTDKKGIQKGIATSLRQGMEDLVPEIRNANQDIRKAKLLETAIADYVRANPQLIDNQRLLYHGLYNSTMGAAGSATGLALGLPSSVMYEALTNPRIRSTLAIIGPGVAATTGKVTARGLGAATSLSHVPGTE